MGPRESNTEGAQKVAARTEDSGLAQDNYLWRVKMRGMRKGRETSPKGYRIAKRLPELADALDGQLEFVHQLSLIED